MNKHTLKKSLIILHDLAVTPLALLASLALRFDGPVLDERLVHWPKVLPFVAAAGLVYWAFRLYQSKWRFASLPDLANIFKASLILAGLLLVIDYVVLADNLYGSYFFGRQTIVIYAIVQMAFLGGPRLAYRYWKDSRVRASRDRQNAAPALILGRAADVDVVLRAIDSGTMKNLAPVGILALRPGDGGQSIRNVPVLGSLADLAQAITDAEVRGTPVRRVVLTPAALGPEFEPEKLLEAARRAGVPVVRLQSLEGGVAGGLAPVEIEDLLLRPAVAIEREPVERFVGGKRVIVTGGGGSIGSEICLRLAAFGAAAIQVIEHAEPAMHHVLEELSALGTTAEIDGRICNVRDAEALKAVMQEFRPDLVFHAAALKHVPYLERDWAEGIRTNVFGSVNVMDAAVAAGAEGVVMISTDKAIKPVSVLGATKRMAELYAELLNREQAATRLLSVRFGNVLGSAGSVVPRFKAQIARGGPVTVTHPEMIRYFMTVREACDLVLTSAAHGAAEQESARASVYVLKMGHPVRILDLAERMVRLSGLEPGRDIEIVTSGTRPGERLHEILFDEDETLVETRMKGVMAARSLLVEREQMLAWLEALQMAVHAGDRAAAERVFRAAVPDYSGGNDTPAA